MNSTGSPKRSVSELADLLIKSRESDKWNEDRGTMRELKFSNID